MSSEQTGFEVDEADLVEQNTEVEPDDEQPEVVGETPMLVDEADWLEQRADAAPDEDGHTP